MAVSVDIGADVTEEVRAVAGRGEERFKARKLCAMLLEDLAVAGEIGGFEGGGGGFGVEEAGELGDQG